MKTYNFETDSTGVYNVIIDLQNYGAKIHNLLNNDEEMSFSFSVKGIVGQAKHRSDTNQLNITIKDKPFLLSWDRIESELNKFFYE